MELDMSEGERKNTETVGSGLSSTRTVVDTVIIVVLSNPFTFYFISFINFFNICSHYVLLNMPIPTHLYKYLSLFYC